MKGSEAYMIRAMELAEKGRGLTSPNPFVGALIVKNENIVGEGFTQTWGKDHAEIQALKKAGKNANGAEMYVTLEPCCIFGKTPPCTDAIIEAGIIAVYIGIIDPNPHVNGNGIKALRAAGISVEVGFMEDSITEQLEYYLTWVKLHRPFVMMKTAMTLDGYIAGSDKGSKWITGEAARLRVHQLRKEVNAIVTGVGSVLADDPLLSSRLPEGEAFPLRIIMDNNLRIPVQSKIVTTSKKQETIVLCQEGSDKNKIKVLEDYGLEVIMFPASVKPYNVLEILKNKNLYCLLIEAGNRVNSEFLRSGVIDKFYFFLAPSLLGNGIKVFSLQENNKLLNKKALRISKMERFDNDILLEAYGKSK